MSQYDGRAPTVTVSGHAVVPAAPDEVEVALEVRAVDDSPAQALLEAGRRGRRLERILDDLGIDRASRSTSRLTVHEASDDHSRSRRESSRGYAASSVIEVRLDDMSQLGALVARATREAQARVDGPRWRIAADNPARDEACRRAAQEARRKASAYAEALGARLGPIVSANEPATAKAGDLEVAATLDVTFALELEPTAEERVRGDGLASEARGSRALPR